MIQLESVLLIISICIYFALKKTTLSKRIIYAASFFFISTAIVFALILVEGDKAQEGSIIYDTEDALKENKLEN
jgi:hypothetical protein